MSFALDVDILLDASDSSSPMHPAALAFLGAVARGDEVCYLPWPTVMGYLRIATHPRIFAAPLTPAEAQGNVDRLLARPHVRSIGEVDGFWDVYRQLARDVPARGNLVPDAHVAAILRQHGIKRLYTRDRDFARFAFLQVVDPFADR